MAKIVIDIERKWLGVGGELHPDAEELLIKKGAKPVNHWGINLFPWHEPENRIEYTALINIRPRQGNPMLEIFDTGIKEGKKNYRKPNYGTR